MDIFEAKNIKPMLATSHEPFDSKDYIYEIKWDGIRCLAYLDSNTHLRSRNNIDISFSYPEFTDMHKWVKETPVILDGEIVVMKNGRPSFHEWQKRGRLKDPKQLQRIAAANPAVYIVFDILYINGKKLMQKPLIERKEILQNTVIERPTLAVSRYIPGEGREMFRAAVQNQLEGVVAKKLDSFYVAGKRTNYWYKFRSVHEEDFVICGYLPGTSDVIGSLVLGAYGEGQLVYQGCAGTGISGKNLEFLLQFIKNKKTDKYPFQTKIKEISKGVWLAPELVCVVEYLEKRETGLRHPVFRGLRFDKDPEDCKMGGS